MTACIIACRRRAGRARTSLLLLAAALALAASAPALAATTERISVATGGAQANAGSNGASMSADGRFVAFSSLASNLVGGDTNGVADVFVRDRMTKTTERVSVASDGTQANAAAADPSISADGRYIAFDSSASNLVAGDTNATMDVFIRDRRTGMTERVSVGPDGMQSNGSSANPQLSADGRFVAFESSASNLVGGDTNGVGDVYVRDRMTKTTERVSVGSDGTQSDPWGSDVESISADGRYVAFDSNFSFPYDGDVLPDVFVHDRQTGGTEQVADYQSGENLADSWGGSISGDGRYVAFWSAEWNPDFIIPDLNLMPRGFVRDRSTGATQRVGEGPAHGAWISRDGRYVALNSDASNLVPNDSNAAADVFLLDRRTGDIQRVNVAADGAQANAGADGRGVSMSAHADVVAFATPASNLVPGDTNGVADVFVRDRGATAARLTLDSHGADPTARMTPPVLTANPLTAARWYVAEVSGTYSSFRREIMSALWTPWRICGTPVSTPAGPTGQDAATIFAWPIKTGDCPRLPLPGYLVMRTGNPVTAAFTRRLPAGGTVTNPAHRYAYYLRGQGFPAAFALTDGYLPDNYGKLAIAVRPTAASDCSNGRWKTWGGWSSEPQCLADF